MITTTTTTITLLLPLLLLLLLLLLRLLLLLPEMASHETYEYARFRDHLYRRLSGLSTKLLSSNLFLKKFWSRRTIEFRFHVLLWVVLLALGFLALGCWKSCCFCWLLLAFGCVVGCRWLSFVAVVVGCRWLLYFACAFNFAFASHWVSKKAFAFFNIWGWWFSSFNILLIDTTSTTTITK